MRPTNPDALLVRAIGVRQLAATIFNYTVASGIFALPATAAAQLGTAAPLAYVVCTAIMLLVVASFAEAGSRVSSTGGPYAYIERRDIRADGEPFRCPGGVLVHLAALGGVVWMLWAIVSRQDLAGVAILLGVTGVAYLLRRRPARA